MQDYMVKVISTSGTIRGYAAITTNLVSQAYQNHTPASLSGIMLGRVLTGASLLGGTLKGEQRISLTFEGTGPLKKIVTESNSKGSVRGYVVRPQLDFSSGEDITIQLRKSIGAAGLVTVSKDLGMKQPYSGSVQIVNGEVGEDIAYYLTESEQIPSAVSVGVIPSEDGKSVDVAGGVLIQSIPSEGGNLATDEGNIEALTEVLSSIKSITTLFANGKTPEDVIKMIFAEIPYKIIEVLPLEYSCSCNKKEIKRAIYSIGKKELNSIFSEQDEIEVVCPFCNSKYYFDSKAIQSI